MKILAPFWNAIFDTQQTTRPEPLLTTLLRELNLALFNNIFWPWIPPAVSRAGRVPFDWSGKLENTSSISISTLQMFMGFPHFIEIFLCGWSLKHSKPSLGMAFWRKEIIIHREIWFITAPLILLWAPLRLDVDDVGLVMWEWPAPAQYVLVVIIMWSR